MLSFAEQSLALLLAFGASAPKVALAIVAPLRGASRGLACVASCRPPARFARPAGGRQSFCTGRDRPYKNYRGFLLTLRLSCRPPARFARAGLRPRASALLAAPRRPSAKSKRRASSCPSNTSLRSCWPTGALALGRRPAKHAAEHEQSLI